MGRGGGEGESESRNGIPFTVKQGGRRAGVCGGAGGLDSLSDWAFWRTNDGTLGVRGSVRIQFFIFIFFLFIHACDHLLKSICLAFSQGRGGGRGE